jgi:flavin reductase (DIM6/NTAB) family NADH-FMN oxidoreductase RutF
MTTQPRENLQKLELTTPVWEQVFSVAPLVLIGSKSSSGEFDLAPKHMALQLGWGNFFGFVCTPRHTTYRNINREGAFTVSYPRPSQVLLASLAASPSDEDDHKPALSAMETFPATEIEGVFVQDAYLYLECRLHDIFYGFKENCLITGEVVAAQAKEGIVRGPDRDDSEIVDSNPLLTYLYPSRYSLIDKSFAFPFPADFKK